MSDLSSAVKLIEMVSGFGSEESGDSSPLIGEKVIVRSRDAGVMFGTLDSLQGQNVVLRDARILWRWKSAKGISLNDVATHGLADHEYNRLSCETEIVHILGACSVLKCTRKACSSLEGIMASEAE